MVSRSRRHLRRRVGSEEEVTRTLKSQSRRKLAHHPVSYQVQGDIQGSSPQWDTERPALFDEIDEDRGMGSKFVFLRLNQLFLRLLLCYIIEYMTL